METPLRSSGPFWLLDPVGNTAETARHDVFRYAGGARAWQLPMVFGGVLLVASVLGGFTTDPTRFMNAYLIGWVFCIALALGALFFVMVHHLVRSHWVVVVRRIAEVTAASFPLLAVMGLPVVISMLTSDHNPFHHWTHPHEGDALVEAKDVYLNVPMFLIRYVVYFGVWSLLGTKLYRLSLQQDAHPDERIPAKQRWWSALGVPLFAVTAAFAAFDFVMSVDPHWFSTIFGVYFFAGSYWTFVAFLAFTLAWLRRTGNLDEVVSANHYLDLGRWMLGFTVFWAYIAFSQYMLIWYGNLKEETVWFTHRMEHGWQYHSAALLVLHFIVPFFFLLFQGPKKNPKWLAFWAVWFFVMEWVDLHWLIMPVYTTDVVAAGGHASTMGWMDAPTGLGLFLLFAGTIYWRLSRHPIVPVNDPRLGASIRYGHV